MKVTEIFEKKSDYSVFKIAKELGLSDLQSRLVSNRFKSDKNISEIELYKQLEKIIFPKLQFLQSPNSLKNSTQAASLIADAIDSKGIIVLATDYDTDGVTSACIATQALVNYFGVPAERVKPIIGERKLGYGLNLDVVERILDIPEIVDLVITADQGSSDEEAIHILSKQGIKVCVTDHHQIPFEGTPDSACCTVNPQQKGCEYDKNVAGCFVIFLVMTQVRNELIKRNKLLADSPSLKDLSINVALGTIADSVSLKSYNNRAIVKAGLNKINLLNIPAWQAMYEFNDNKKEPINAEYLGFQVATRINAASRVSNVMTAFNFLNSKNSKEANLFLKQLDNDNNERKSQQQRMLDDALDYSENIYNSQKYSLVIKMVGNAGIQGIIASRIGEKYGLPTIAMTDLNDGYLAGSGRAILENIDLRQAFQWMSEQHTALFKSMGGHKGAVGCTIPIDNFDVFSDLFEKAVKNQVGENPPIPVIKTDGDLTENDLTPNLINEINLLEPYGRDWPYPVFSGKFVIASIKEVGHTKTHLSMNLKTKKGKSFNSIYFNAKNSSDIPTPFVAGEYIQCAYQPVINNFYGNKSLQLRIQTAKSV